MKTVTKEYKVFEFSELSEKAQAYAYDRWYEGQEFGWSEEYQDTLKAFCEKFNVKVTDWNVDTFSSNFSFRIMDDGYDSDNKKTIREKIRLSKFIINHLSGDTTDCIFTGFCADCSILDVYNSVKNWKQVFSSYEDFIRASLDVFFSTWSDDMKYAYSEEAFLECYANENEYLESGKVF